MSAPRRGSADAAVLCAALAVLGLCEATARASRVAAPAPAVLKVATAADVLDAWRRAGVRGRVLVHAARKAGLADEEGPATAAGFVRRAVQDGILRRVHHVVPEADWPEVAARLRALPGATERGGTFRLADEGTPIVVSRLAELADVGEAVLVDVEPERFSPGERDVLARRLRAGRPGADLVAAWGAGAATLPALEVTGAAPE